LFLFRLIFRKIAAQTFKLMVYSTAYLPPIAYWYFLSKDENPVIDIYEHFVKQTYRNRCEIYGANGKLSLTIPLVKENEHTPIKNRKISYAENWQKNHWKSIESAYRSSPYFEYYEQEFYDFFHKKDFELLVDFNTALMQKIMEILELSVPLKFSEKYIENVNTEEDLRLLTPKKELKILVFPRYIQVFENKKGFIPNLSILDLLCNEGPQSVNYLQSIKRTNA